MYIDSKGSVCQVVITRWPAQASINMVCIVWGLGLELRLDREQKKDQKEFKGIKVFDGNLGHLSHLQVKRSARHCPHGCVKNWRRWSINVRRS